MQDPPYSTALDLTALARYLSQKTSADPQNGIGPPIPTEPLLCYGLGEAEEPLSALQNNMLTLLTRETETEAIAGQRWVCFGASLRLLADRLTAQGADCSWLGPQVRGREAGDSSTTAIEPTFLATDLPQECAGIILEGTINYLDQMPILQHARAHLARGGRLLLLGEFLQDDSVIAYSPLPNLASCRDLSARLGFELQSEDELSAGAQMTLAKLSSMLQSDSGDGSAAVASLLPTVQAIAGEYQNGRRSLRLFQWRWLPNDKDEYAEAEFADIHSFPPAEIADLFQRSFNVEFNPDLWRWKYQLGNGKCVVARARPGTPIVAHYGGAPRRIHYFGQPATAIQVCDVMVLPESRRQYGRSSLFFRTAATFLEREIGNSVGHLLGFGFPNQKAMNIARRLGLYDKTDDFVELVLPAGETGWQVEELDVSRAAETIDHLWQQMSADFAGGIIGVRDSEYFRYRYLDHPYGKQGLYKPLLLGDGAPKAVAVLKKHGEHWLVMELIAARSDMVPALRCLAAWGQHALPEAALKFWVTRGYLEMLRGVGTIVNDLGIEIPCNSWNRGPAADILAGHWWLTAGDMDFL